MRVSPAQDGKVFVAIRDQSELLSKVEAEAVVRAIKASLALTEDRSTRPVTTAAERT